jgi:PKD repeat protein
VTKVEHRYADIGVYTVTVTASNEVSTQTAQSIVRVIAPISGLKVVAPTSAKVGESVLFTATQTGGLAIYSWNFGDANLQSGALVSHTYALAGEYTVALTATNEISVQRLEHHLHVFNRAIEDMEVLAPSSVGVAQTVWLTATQTGGTDVTFVWLLGDGQVKEGPVISHIYGAPGVYTVTVVARNEVSEQTREFVIEVIEVINEDWSQNWLPLIMK